MISPVFCTYIRRKNVVRSLHIQLSFSRKWLLIRWLDHTRVAYGLMSQVSQTLDHDEIINTCHHDLATLKNYANILLIGVKFETTMILDINHSVHLQAPFLEQISI